MAGTLRALDREVIACERCERLVSWCRRVAREKKASLRDAEYWGKPVPSFGDADPRLLIVGLAPGAHGANRTGRIFTGDSSGDWLFAALHAHGFANRAQSVRKDDGLRLLDARVTCPVRCAPPDNKPTRAEADACRPYLVEELAAYRKLAVVLVLGRFGFDEFRRAWTAAGGAAFAGRPAFAHGAEFRTADGRVTLVCSYHPSRQNTQTGRLTRAMFHRPFARARALLEGDS